MRQGVMASDEGETVNEPVYGERERQKETERDLLLRHECALFLPLQGVHKLLVGVILPIADVHEI